MSQTLIPAPPTDGPFHEQIRAFMEKDAREFPAPGSVVFIGSSSIALWSEAQDDFPFINLIRRGFGGSTIPQSTLYADRIAIPYAPRLIVMYAGDNDLAHGASPEQVCADFKAFVARVRAALPDVEIVFASIKFSPSRWHLKAEIARANALIQKFCEATPRTHFVDLTMTMLGENGEPRPELFKDGLHPNRAGYRAWTGVLAPAIKGLLNAKA
jgi:lysophospholipase L1-like esterase